MLKALSKHFNKHIYKLNYYEKKRFIKGQLN